ncbi:hypothetical protein AGDE_00110 [Angomonas deanei]|nr:hypothetical protein AGDE_00110 [Angomonas deanei]|eukprot:EPY43811.1 hypothetical protein AGDE_00110 [Angomonas deanei]
MKSRRILSFGWSSTFLFSRRWFETSNDNSGLTASASPVLKRQPRQTSKRRPATTADNREEQALSTEQKSTSYGVITRQSSFPLSDGNPYTKEVQNAYKQTLEKRFSPRHGSLSSSLRVNKEEGEEKMDPALVVRLDSRKKEIQLNPIQRELLWTARQKEYHSLLLRIVTCLQSHQTAIEQCHTLLSLHDEVIRQRLRLRTDTYEDIFHTFYAVAVQGKANPTLHQRAETAGGNPLLEQEVAGTSVEGALSLSAPEEWRSPLVAAQALLGPASIQKIWTMYRYLVDSGTKPSSRILQYVMGILDRSLLVHRGDPNQRLLTESKAHSLMMDADRYRLAPSEFTINSYIGVCDACGVMYLATARVADYFSRHERQPSAGMYTRLLCGLIRHGQYQEALSVVTTMQNVPMTTHLVNAVLHVARHSQDPLSVFSIYRAVFTHSSQQDTIRPSLHTFSILLEVVRECRSYAEVNFILKEMKFFGVKGNGMVLNRILEIFLLAGKTKEADSLARQMQSKNILVFDEQRKRLQQTAVQQLSQ